MITFEFAFTDAYLIEALRRHRQGKKWGVLFVALKVLLGLCVAGLAILCLKLNTYWPEVVFAFVLFVLIFARRIDEWLACRRLRKSPYLGQQHQMEFSVEGIKTATPVATSQATWAIFTGGKRVRDGFLLKQGSQMFNWLPDSSLTTGTVEEAGTLFQTHVAGYQQGG